MGREPALNSEYFSKKINQLESLRNFLLKFPKTKIFTLEECRSLAKEALSIDPRRNRDYEALGTYIKELGGVSGFLEKPIYELNSSILITTYALS